MIIDIGNEVYTNLKASLVGITTFTAYPDTEPTFPCVVFSELTNTSNESTVDSGGEKYNDISFEVNIFSSSHAKLTEIKTIRKLVDDVMSSGYRMNRSFANPTPNYLDTSVERYTLRYDFTVDENKKVYRR